MLKLMQRWDEWRPIRFWAKQSTISFALNFNLKVVILSSIFSLISSLVLKTHGTLTWTQLCQQQASTFIGILHNCAQNTFFYFVWIQVWGLCLGHNSGVKKAASSKFLGSLLGCCMNDREIDNILGDLSDEYQDVGADQGILAARLRMAQRIIFVIGPYAKRAATQFFTQLKYRL